MDLRSCAACDRPFHARAQTPRQAYCPADACQQERRRRWQRAKRLSDPDYRENQHKAQRAWCKRNPGYWRDYRTRHPAYRERNRLLQRTRGGAGAVAKMDASSGPPLRAGLYSLVPRAPSTRAKSNAWVVEITWISKLPRA